MKNNLKMFGNSGQFELIFITKIKLFMFMCLYLKIIQI